MHFKVFSGYYYTRLSKAEQKIYKEILRGLYAYEKQITLPCNVSSDDCNKIVNAVRMDVPELFYVDFTSYTISWSFNRTCVVFTFLESFNDAEVMKARLFDEVRKIKNLCSGFLDKEKAIHDYMADKIKYDHTLSCSHIYDAYGAIVLKNCVCEGYSKAFKLFCDEFRIPCICVVGKSMKESHAWNIVRLKDKCFHVDVTWNSNLRKSVDIPVYYNVSDSFMAMDHIWEKSEFPSCSTKGIIEKEIIDVVGMSSFADSLENMVGRKRETFILRFNRKFDSVEEINSLLNIIVSKRRIKGLSSWSITYLEKLNCAVMKVKYSFFRF